MAKKMLAYKYKFRYVCEHCGKEADWREVSITGKNEKEIRGKIPEVKQAASSGDIHGYLPLGVGKCGACGKHQSWSVSSIKGRLSMAMWGGLAMGAVGAWILTSIMIGGLLWGAIGFIVGFCVGFPICLIVQMVGYSRVKKDMTLTQNRFLPEIVWSDETEFM